MKTYKIANRIMAFVAALGLMFQGAVPVRAAQTNVAEKAAKPSIDVSKVRVPEVYGTIKEAHKGNDKVIFYLQDAHCNLEAQQNNEKIAEDLMNQYGIDTVCEEGLVGAAADISKMAAAKNKAVRDDMANYYLEHGLFSGLTHLRATSEKPFNLYGLEDEALYNENIEAFSKTASFQKDAAAQIKEIGKVLGSIAQKTWSEDLKAFADKAADYRAGKAKFTEFAQALRDAAAKHGVDITAHKNFDLQGKSFAMEGKINFDAVEDERSAIVDEVSKKLSKEDASSLVVQSLSFRLGRLSAVEYYDVLKAHCEKNGVDLKIKANLSGYIDYIKVFEQINKDALVEEANAVEAAVKDKLFTSDDQRKLDKMITHMDMVARMFDVKLGIRDYKVYAKNAPEVKMVSVVEFVKAQAPIHGIAVPTVDVATLENQVGGIENFYSIATRRDEVLSKNAVALMNDKKLDKMIMVTGGFHTSAIADQLKKEGFSLVVITPRITNFDAKSPYAEAMLGKVTKYWAAKSQEVEAETVPPKTEPEDPDQGGTPPTGQGGQAKAIGPTVDHASSARLNADIVAGIVVTIPADLQAELDAEGPVDVSGLVFKTARTGKVFELDTVDGKKTIAHASVAWEADATGGLIPVIGSPTELWNSTLPEDRRMLVLALRGDIAKARAFVKLGFDPRKLVASATVSQAEADRQQHIRRVADLMKLMAEKSPDRIFRGLEYFTQTPEGIAELVKMASDAETKAVIAKAAASIDAVLADTSIPAASRPTAAQAQELKDFSKKLAAEVKGYIPQALVQKFLSVAANDAKRAAMIKVVSDITEPTHQDVKINVLAALNHVDAFIGQVKTPPVGKELKIADFPGLLKEMAGVEEYVSGFKFNTSNPDNAARDVAQAITELGLAKQLMGRDHSFAELVKAVEAKTLDMAQIKEFTSNVRNLVDYDSVGGVATNFKIKSANALKILKYLLENKVIVNLYATDLTEPELKNLLNRAYGIDVDALKKIGDFNLFQAGPDLKEVFTRLDANAKAKRINPVNSRVAAYRGDDTTKVQGAGYKTVIGQPGVTFDNLVSLAMLANLSDAEIQDFLKKAGVTDAAEAAAMVAAVKSGGLIPPVSQTKSIMDNLNANPRSVEVAA